jgi:hypothetical protein
VVIFRDGAAWLAVRPDFEDIQSSPVGSGTTPGAAVDELLSADGPPEAVVTGPDGNPRLVPG